MNDHITAQNEIENVQKSNSNLFLAVVFIMIGGGLLISNLTSFTFKNWWALFLLIPAGGFMMNAWRDVQENGRLTRRSTGAIIPGIILLTMVAIFLFDLSWTIFWPIILIAVGFSILVGRD